VLLQAATAFLLPALLSATEIPIAREPLGPEKALDLESVADPQLSPDGEWVLYSRGGTDRTHDRILTKLWLAERRSGRERAVAEGSNARWSPDGRRFAYIANDPSARPQVFLGRPDDESGGSQLTELALPPRDLQWSPDGRRLSFRAPVPGPQPGDIPVPMVAVPPNATPPPEVIDVLPFRFDGLGTHAGAYEHLFVIPAAGGAARQLTSGSWHVGAKPYGFDLGTATRWAPDGSAIYFDGVTAGLPDPLSPTSYLYRVDVASGVIEQVTRSPGFWVSPNISPDGRWLAYVGFDAGHFPKSYKTRELWVSRVDGSDARMLSSPLDGDAEDVIWAPDSRGLYFTMELEGERAIYYVPLGGLPRTVTSRGFVGHLASIDGAGRRLAAVQTSTDRPGDVVIVDLRRRGKVDFLTAVNDEVLAQVELGRVEEIRFASPDGTPLQGWIVQPPGFEVGHRYPLVLEIHGGPHDAYNAGFSRYFQAIAARGYVVLYMNPRGSRGYGTAFGNAIQNAFPGDKDYEDLMAGVDAVMERGYVDPRRLFVTGCSAGGALTTWIVAHTNRFAAAASLCPVSNWISYAGTADVAGWSMRRFDRPFWEDPSAWLDHSPIMRVGAIQTPLLIMTGESDLRTPMSQSEELFAALKSRGVPTRLVRMRNESHGTTYRPSNFVRTIVFLDSWFRHWDPVGRAVEDRLP
jgi:dipeptidyl aminopeptidase/acylaminoacyl peptidase